MSTTRSASLVLGGLTVPLDNLAGGWVCTELDLGTPDMREVKNNRPDKHGVIDRTMYWGGRVVTCKIRAFPGGTVNLDDCYAQFMPFMDPSQRPVLHVFIQSDTITERIITLRASAIAAPMDQPIDRQFQLTWIAADPIMYDVNQKTATAYSGAAGTGRTYNFHPPRSYPAGSGSSSNGTILSNGSMLVKPLLRIYGPISGATVTLDPVFSPNVYTVAFLSSFRIDALHHVDIDCDQHTAYWDGDPTQSVLNQMDWSRTLWPWLPVAPDTTVMSLTGTNTTGVSQVQAIWNDGYMV